MARRTNVLFQELFHPLHAFFGLSLDFAKAFSNVQPVAKAVSPAPGL